MSHVLILTLDRESDRKLSDLQTRIQGLLNDGPTSVQAVRPHITLGGFEGSQPVGLVERLREFSREHAPLQLELASLGTFSGTECTVFIAPVVTQSLLHFHQAIYTRLLSQAQLHNPYYVPGAWVPHITLATQVPESSFPGILAFCREAEIFERVTATHISLFDYPPFQNLAEYPLGG